MTVDLDLRAFRPAPATLRYGSAVLGAELLALLVYLSLSNVTLLTPRYALYGLLWVNVGLWVLWRTDVAPMSARTRRRAATVAVVYFGALAVAGGLVGPASPAGATGVRLAWLPPGWGPALLYGGSAVNLVLMPARVVGYLALSYLVYATVVDAAGAAVSGIVGLFSCVSCSWPILASVASGLLGSGSALAAATTALSYDLSTAVFLLTVALLYWRPGFGGRF